MSFQGVSDLQRLRLESRLKRLERRLKSKRIRWRDLKRLMPTSVHALTREGVALDDPALPPMIREYLQGSDQLKVGSITPLLLSPEGAWWVRITSVSRGDLFSHVHMPSSAIDANDQAQRELKQIQERLLLKARVEVLWRDLQAPPSVDNHSDRERTAILDLSSFSSLSSPRLP